MECLDCPSSRKTGSIHLDNRFIKRLFSFFEGQTKGLLLSGGEPTLSPSFPEVLRLAKDSGFKNIAVVTNGTLLDEQQVQSALLSHASAIRISLYGWNRKSCEGIATTLRRIESLRKQIDRTGSALQIGVSALTSKEKANKIDEIATAVYEAGAHWIYFHPMCTKWEHGTPTPVDQKEVLERVETCQNKDRDGFGRFVLRDRYLTYDLDFDQYHAAHFLLVIGADGVNYLSAEGKYRRQYAIANVMGNGNKGFLWESDRLKRIRSFSSQEYPALKSRHRGILYSHLIDRLKSGKDILSHLADVDESAHMYPHIL